MILQVLHVIVCGINKVDKGAVEVAINETYTNQDSHAGLFDVHSDNNSESNEDNSDSDDDSEGIQKSVKEAILKIYIHQSSSHSKLCTQRQQRKYGDDNGNVEEIVEEAIANTYIHYKSRSKVSFMYFDYSESDTFVSDSEYDNIGSDAYNSDRDDNNVVATIAVFQHLMLSLYFY